MVVESLFYGRIEWMNRMNGREEHVLLGVIKLLVSGMFCSVRTVLTVLLLLMKNDDDERWLFAPLFIVQGLFYGTELVWC